MRGTGAGELRARFDEAAGRVEEPDPGTILAELADVVAAIELALDAVSSSEGLRAGVHMGKVTAQDDALGGHAGRATSALAELADAGRVLMTGGVLVEMGDDGFERFVTGSMGAADLDGTSYAVYRISRRG